jgi:hypothetical protein
MTFAYWYGLPTKRKSWGYKSVADWIARNPGRAAGRAVGPVPEAARYWLEKHVNKRKEETIRLQWSVVRGPDEDSPWFLVELTAEEAREWLGLALTYLTHRI